MAVCQTQHFGLVEYEAESLVEFPEGIPAFPEALLFILVEPPAMAPLIYLQSLIDPELCFLTVPAACLDPAYQLHVPDEELRDLGDSNDRLTLAILTVSETHPPTANLMAPVVIHRGTRRGRQVLQIEGGYSFTHPLTPPPPTPPVKESSC